MNASHPIDDQLYRSAWNQYVVGKAMGILLLVIAALLLFSPGASFGAIFVIGVPMLIAGTLGATLAELEAAGNGVRYRRFLRWRSLPYSEIRSVGRAWGAGWLRPCRPIPPWGILFFTLANSIRWHNPLIAHLEKNLEQVHGLPPRSGFGPRRTAATFGMLGVVVALVVGLLVPSNLTSALATAPQSLANPALANLAPYLVPAREIGWGIVGMLLIVFAWRGRQTRLFAFLGGLALGWFVLAAPITLH